MEHVDSSSWENKEGEFVHLKSKPQNCFKRKENQVNLKKIEILVCQKLAYLKICSDQLRNVAQVLTAEVDKYFKYA